MRPAVVLALAVTCIVPRPAAAQVLYVDADARGADDGTSWADAFPSLQEALAAATAGMEVWVAEGVYRPTGDADRTATFQLLDGVALYGGFAGTETTRGARDWTQHETILSGDIGVIGAPHDNAYHVVTASGAGASAVLDGFVITGAYGDGAFPRNRGGGLRNVGGHPTIRHCIFRGNRIFSNDRAGFGAGMFNAQAARPTLVDVRFEDNHAEGASGGGGMANKDQSHPLLFGVTFARNSAGQLGGGMTNDTGSSPILVDVTFRENRSVYTGGMDNYQRAQPVLWNVRFEGNTASEYGGGMTNDTEADAHLYNVVFVGNASGNATKPGGGALHNDGSSPTLVHVTFAGNRAADGAGAVYSTGTGTPRLRNAILWDNGTEIVGPAQVEYALVQGGFAEGTAVLRADPRFERPPAEGDYGDLRLHAASPALHAGKAAFLPADAQDLDGDGDTAEPLPVDLDYRARLVRPAVDLGAFERPALPASPTMPRQ